MVEIKSAIKTLLSADSKSTTQNFLLKPKQRLQIPIHNGILLNLILSIVFNAFIGPLSMHATRLSTLCRTTIVARIMTAHAIFIQTIAQINAGAYVDSFLIVQNSRHFSSVFRFGVTLPVQLSLLSYTCLRIEIS